MKTLLAPDLQFTTLARCLPLPPLQNEAESLLHMSLIRWCLLPCQYNSSKIIIAGSYPSYESTRISDIEQYSRGSCSLKKSQADSLCRISFDSCECAVCPSPAAVPEVSGCTSPQQRWFVSAGPPCRLGGQAGWLQRQEGRAESTGQLQTLRLPDALVHPPPPTHLQSLWSNPPFPCTH